MLQIIKFIGLFVCLLPLLVLIDNKFADIVSYSFLYGTTLLFARNKLDILWYILAYMHGLAHIYVPALRGTIPNLNYDPIYDYMIHAAQCLCIYNYHHNWFPVGVMIHSSMLTGAIIGHLDSKFFETYLWIVISAGGVFGTHYHMMLLNKTKNKSIFIASCIIWITPYIGYLDIVNIPQWDSFLNSIGLFRVWYLNFFVTMKLFEYIEKLKNNYHDNKIQNYGLHNIKIQSKAKSKAKT